MSGIKPVVSPGQPEQVFHYKYLKEFRVEQCPQFLQHKCQQHRPFTCFHWHFQNQKRRRPIKRKDGTFNYNADVYCNKFDETTGICADGDECPYLHRTAGDTERRYHLKYYKTGMCVHDTDNRGFCVKNGPHCAFAHGTSDLRAAVYDIRELQAIENGETGLAAELAGNASQQGILNSLDKERSLVNDDPKWLDTTYVLANYKTEPCKKPPRLCRQGYACPQFHNNKDKRRSPKKFKYRSTPCPNVKSGDEWGDPSVCEAGDQCQYCHTRTEQQFHPEIYKSTKCNDIQNTSYCPRGAFCAFAHIEQETVSLESPPPESNAHNISDLLSQVLPEDEIRRNAAVAALTAAAEQKQLEMAAAGMSLQQRAPGSQLGNRNGSMTPPFEENGIASPISDKTGGNGNSIRTSLNLTSSNGLSNSSTLGTSIDSALVPSPNTYPKNRFLSGDLNSNREAYLRRQFMSIEADPMLSPIEKAQRKASIMLEASVAATCSSGGSSITTLSNGIFSSFGQGGDQLELVTNGIESMTTNGSIDPFDGNKSRKSSGFSDGTNGGGSKSRQYSGYELQNKSRNCSGNSISAGLVSSGILNGSAPVMIPGSDNISPQANSPLGGMNVGNDNRENTSNLMRQNQFGMFDLTNAKSSSNANDANTNSIANTAQKDNEIARLKEELAGTRILLSSWEDKINQARTACEAWQKETVMAQKKVEIALRDKQDMMSKTAQLAKEVEMLSGGPHLHVIKRVSDLKGLPLNMLKAIEIQLRKDLQEVDKAMQSQTESQWFSNNRLFDFPPTTSSSGINTTNGSTNDWSLGLISNQLPIYGSGMAQQ